MFLYNPRFSFNLIFLSISQLAFDNDNFNLWNLKKFSCKYEKYFDAVTMHPFLNNSIKIREKKVKWGRSIRFVNNFMAFMNMYNIHDFFYYWYEIGLAPPPPVSWLALRFNFLFPKPSEYLKELDFNIVICLMFSNKKQTFFSKCLSL